MEERGADREQEGRKEDIPARIETGRRTREREEVSECGTGVGDGWIDGRIRPACGTDLSGLGMNGQCHETVSIHVGGGEARLSQRLGSK